jgi:hypothetical protein
MSQIGNLTLDLFLGHNFCFEYSNGSCKPITDIYVSRDFQWYKELFNPMNFHPLKYFFEDLGLHKASNSQSGSPFGSANKK